MQETQLRGNYFGIAHVHMQRLSLQRTSGLAFGRSTSQAVQALFSLKNYFGNLVEVARERKTRLAKLFYLT